MEDFEEGRPIISGNNEKFGFWNVFHMGSGFLLLFLAFNTAQALQSSINADVGIIALGALYLSFSLTSFFGATLFTDKLGSKMSLVIGGACYIPYLAANIKVFSILLVLCSVVTGFGAALLWTGQGVYLIENSNKENQGKHSGVFWALFQINTIGNLIAQLIRNSCLEKANAYLFSGLTVAASMGVLILLFLRQPRSKKVTSSINSEEKKIDVGQAFRMIRDSRILHLAPLFIYVGMTVTIYYGTITSRMDQRWLGYIMTVFGVVDTFGSMIAGKISDVFGRKPILLFGFLTSVSGILVANFAGNCNLGDSYDACDSDDDFGSLGIDSDSLGIDPDSVGDVEECEEIRLILFFVSAVLNGFSDGIYNTQVVAVVGDVFSDNAAETTTAFAISVFLKATTSGIMFFVSLGIGLLPQSIMMIVILIIALVLFVRLTINPSYEVVSD